MNWKTIFSVMSLLLLSEIVIATDGKIDRKALVSRHNIIQTKVDKLSPLSVGNGRFCYTTDITSMQTFPELYREGIPLSTMSEWGWHSFPNTRNYQLSDVFTYLDVYGKKCWLNHNLCFDYAFSNLAYHLSNHFKRYA